MYIHVHSWFWYFSVCSHSSNIYKCNLDPLLLLLLWLFHADAIPNQVPVAVAVVAVAPVVAVLVTTTKDAVVEGAEEEGVVEGAEEEGAEEGAVEGAEEGAGPSSKSSTRPLHCLPRGLFHHTPST